MKSEFLEVPVSMISQCPTCNTRFKVTQAQLEAHQGLVRCGRCQAVFNATEYLQDDQPSPQLELLIDAQEPPQAQAEVITELPVETAAEAATTTQVAEQHDTERQHAKPYDKIELAQPITHAQKVTFAEFPDAPAAEPARKKRTWPWLAGSFFMFIVLLAQAAYFYRVELAANQPNLKPALLSYCRLLKCTVPLPQKADLMSIESSDLEADPAQSGVIALNALMRNHATYAQAYPNLELTLTDLQNKSLARRTFRPMEYLKPEEDEKQGLAANREISVKLNLDTTDLSPSGYRLYLFYPE